MPSSQSSISLIDASPPSRRAKVTTWITQFKAGEARLDAVADFLDKAITIEQKELLIEVIWEVMTQARE